MEQMPLEPLNLETKEKLLLKPILNAKDIATLTSFSRAVCYRIMTECREKWDGRVGCRTDVVTTKSVLKLLGSTIEEEMRLIGIAKGFIKI